MPLRNGEIALYRAIREAVPIVDAALIKLIRLVGGVRVQCGDPRAQEGLERFLRTVPTGRGQRGVQSFLDCYMDSLLTCGRAVGELVLDPDGREVAALLCGNAADLEIRGETPLDFTLCARRENGQIEELPCQELLLFTPFQPETDSPYGVSLLRSMPFLTGILLKIYQAMGMNWERMGNVRFAVVCKPGEDGLERTCAQERCRQIAQEWSAAMQAGKNGGVRDFVAVGDVDIKVIGADNQVLDSEVPVRQILEQLIAKTESHPSCWAVLVLHRAHEHPAGRHDDQRDHRTAAVPGPGGGAHLRAVAAGTRLRRPGGGPVGRHQPAGSGGGGPRRAVPGAGPGGARTEQRKIGEDESLEIKNDAGLGRGPQVDRRELEQIHQFSRKELTAEEVYTFSVRLCDNEIDRDGERFSPQALETLAEKFVGKSGIFDHEWSARGQTARIYRAEVVREPEATTRAGDPLCYVKGYAYMLRTEANRDLIAEIDAGIKREVSVGCAVERSVCSVCGEDIRDREKCRHIRGRTYNGKLCWAELDGVTDAYEWSFVAVPAQPGAGVLKGFRGEARLERLEQEAALGRKYLAGLRREVARLGALAELELEAPVLERMTEKLEEGELEALRKALEKRTRERYALRTQLTYSEGQEQETARDGAFLI